MEPFKKVVRPGTGENGKVFCKITWDGKRLSISGVEGPKRNGDCRGASGQIDPVIVLVFAPGWSQEALDIFNKVWAEHHLNDMNAGCTHQRALGWKPCPTHYPTEEQKKAPMRLTCSGELEPWEDPDLDKDRVVVAKAILKQAGWTAYAPGKRKEYRCREDKLSKPCPECGYEYGSAWLYEPVPEIVLEFLFNLPDTDETPAWV